MAVSLKNILFVVGLFAVSAIHQIIGDCCPIEHTIRHVCIGLDNEEEVPFMDYYLGFMYLIREKDDEFKKNVLRGSAQMDLVFNKTITIVA